MAESIWDSVIHNLIGAKHWDQLTENDEERDLVLALAEETLKKANELHVKK